MNVFKRMISLCSKKKSDDSPFIIIKKNLNDDLIVDYALLENKIIDLEKDINIHYNKIENLKLQLEKLKNKSPINIRDEQITDSTK